MTSLSIYIYISFQLSELSVDKRGNVNRTALDLLPLKYDFDQENIFMTKIN